MRRAKQINELNQKELRLGYTNTPSSWHHQEKNKTAYIYIGGLDFRLTEGDLLSVFSQYGEVVDIDLVRDEKERTSKGFCFIAYEDINSTILAIDNLNGVELGNRIICVDHAPNYYKKLVEEPEPTSESNDQRKYPSRDRDNRPIPQTDEQYEIMERDGVFYKRKLNDPKSKAPLVDWTIDHDATKKKDPNWIHKYLMQNLYENTGVDENEDDVNDEGNKLPSVVEKKEEETEEGRRKRKEDKKRKKEEKREKKEAKKLKKMEEKMFGGLKDN